MLWGAKVKGDGQGDEVRVGGSTYGHGLKAGRIITDANGVVLATTAANGGSLLPSIGILASGETLQTGGLCTLWGIFTADYSGLAGAGINHTSALVESAGTNGIQIAQDANGNATET